MVSFQTRVELFFAQLKCGSNKCINDQDKSAKQTTHKNRTNPRTQRGDLSNYEGAAAIVLCLGRW